MFIVIEVQANSDGTAGTLVDTYKDSERGSAESKYHTILAYAATSTVYRHSAFMITENGQLIRSECYVHEMPEPEPEPTVEEGE